MKKIIFILCLILLSTFFINCNKDTKFTIVYDLDGGLCDSLVEEYLFGEEVVLPTPTKEGYNFLGWFDGDVKIDKISNGNYQLKAMWEKIIIKEMYSTSWLCTNLDLSIPNDTFNLTILNNVLYVADKEIGEFKEVDEVNKIFDNDRIHVNSTYEEVFEEIKKIKDGYYIEEATNNDFKMRVYLIESNNEKYIFFGALINDTEFELYKGYYLIDKALLEFTDYPGGCIVMKHHEYVDFNKFYDLSKVKELLFAEAFIDLKTLEIYTDTIEVTKNLDLITYNNGVYDIYITEYLLDNDYFTFGSLFYTLDELKNYEYQLVDEEIIIVDNDITYTFGKSIQLMDSYYLKEVKANKPLFNDYQKSKEALDILYGSSDYNKYLVSVELNENSFVIKLAERTIAG